MCDSRGRIQCGLVDFLHSSPGAGQLSEGRDEDGEDERLPLPA